MPLPSPVRNFAFFLGFRDFQKGRRFRDFAYCWLEAQQRAWASRSEYRHMASTARPLQLKDTGRAKLPIYTR